MVVLAIGIAYIFMYVAYCIGQDKRVPPSISETFYSSGKPVFSIVMLTESVILTYSLIELSPENWQWLGFIAGAAVGFVGASPYFKRSFEGTVHNVSAVIFAVCTQLWVMIVAHPLVMLTFIPAIILSKIFPSKKIFIIEMACIVNVGIALLII